MDINRENLDSMFKSYMTAWQEGLILKDPIDLSFLFSDFPSSSKANFYAWLDIIPGFREWLGDRIFKNVRSNNFEVVNRDFEDSSTIPNNDIEDDQFGVYAPIIRMMAAAWPQLKYTLVVDVLKNNPLSFTGKALFANDHAYGGNTIDNLVTDALSATSYEAARLAASEWQYSNDELIRPNFTHLLVGEKNRTTAYNIVVNERIVAETGAGGSKENPNKGTAIPVVIPDFAGTYDDYWVLVDGSQPVHAICRQIRKEAAPFMDTDPATVMRSGQVDFMADGRGAAAPAFPHMVFGGRL